MLLKTIIGGIFGVTLAAASEYETKIYDLGSLNESGVSLQTLQNFQVESYKELEQGDVSPENLKEATRGRIEQYYSSLSADMKLILIRRKDNADLAGVSWIKFWETDGLVEIRQTTALHEQLYVTIVLEALRTFPLATGLKTMIYKGRVGLIELMKQKRNAQVIEPFDHSDNPENYVALKMDKEAFQSEL